MKYAHAWNDKTYIEKCKFALCVSISVFIRPLFSVLLSFRGSAHHFSCCTLSHLNFVTIFLSHSSRSIFFPTCRFVHTILFFFVSPDHSVSSLYRLLIHIKRGFDMRFRVWALHIWIKRFIKLTSILPTAICSLAQVGSVQLLLLLLWLCARVCVFSLSVSYERCPLLPYERNHSKKLQNNRIIDRIVWTTNNNINTEIEIISPEKSHHDDHVPMNDHTLCTLFPFPLALHISFFCFYVSPH